MFVPEDPPPLPPIYEIEKKSVLFWTHISSLGWCTGAHFRVTCILQHLTVMMSREIFHHFTKKHKWSKHCNLWHWLISIKKYFKMGEKAWHGNIFYNKLKILCYTNGVLLISYYFMLKIISTYGFALMTSLH